MRLIHHVCLGKDQLDIANENSILKAIDKYKPWGIINASGYVKVDEAENDMATCFAINTSGPENLARICSKLGIKLMTFSSDFVFDGSKRLPYIEDDLISPLNVYGKSKAIGESLVQAANPDSLIIRTSSFFGPWDKYNFAYQVITSLQQNRPCCVVKDVVMSPTYIPDLVGVSMDLFIDDETGIWHICNDGTISWAGFAVAIAERAGFSKNRLKEMSLTEMRWRAKRPLYSVLENSRGIKLPTIDNALTRFFEQKIYS
jgi:dTDP-4-dehydrorhamnose reductase